MAPLVKKNGHPRQAGREVKGRAETILASIADPLLSAGKGEFFR
jgi:hypothetical protein